MALDTGYFFFLFGDSLCSPILIIHVFPSSILEKSSTSASHLSFLGLLGDRFGDFLVFPPCPATFRSCFSLLVGATFGLVSSDTSYLVPPLFSCVHSI